MRSLPRKAFLLAAGHGTRLRPLTNTTPKCLLPIRGVPMLQIWLERCERLGVEEVLINLHSNADVIREFLYRNNSSEVRVYISDEPVLLGSAGTVAINREWVDGEQSFWIFYADVLTNADLDAMVRFHHERSAGTSIGVYRVPDPSRCGIVQVNEHSWVTEFVEKPKVPVGNLAFSGIILGGPEFLDAIPQRRPADIGFDVLPKLVGRMAAYEVTDYLIDIGTMENYRAAQDTWPGMQALEEQERHA